jgi:hypothetical protein
MSKPDQTDAQNGENHQVQQRKLGDCLRNNVLGGQSITPDEDLA